MRLTIDRFRMALYAENLNKITWECVHFEEFERIENILTDLKNNSIKLIRFDISEVNTDKQLFERISQALHFPGYFGNNWDAMDECLFDMEWIPADGYTITM